MAGQEPWAGGEPQALVDVVNWNPEPQHTEPPVSSLFSHLSSPKGEQGDGQIGISEIPPLPPPALGKQICTKPKLGVQIILPSPHF